MYCKECGKEIDDNSKFCNICGTKLTDTIDTNDVANKSDIINNIEPKNKSKHNLRKKIEYIYWVHKKAFFIGLTTLFIIIVTISLLIIFNKKEYNSNDIFNIADPSTVEITTYSISDFKMAVGSGFIISKDGEIVTNYHVIEGANKIRIRLNNGDYHWVTYVIGYNEILDLAIIKIDASNLKPLKISNREIQTGDVVYAMGSSQGLTGTFSSGIVSTSSRKVENINCIQITAPISQGNSGGPLINVYGEVVGVNAMILSTGQNINFAIKIYQLVMVDRRPLTIENYYSKTAYYTVAVNEILKTEIEPNDLNNLATNIEKNGTTINASFNGVTDTDLYHFRPSKSGILDIFIFSEKNEDADYIELVLLNSVNTQLSIGRIYTYRSINQICIRYNVLENENYYIKLNLNSSYPSHGANYHMYIFVK